MLGKISTALLAGCLLACLLTGAEAARLKCPANCKECNRWNRKCTRCYTTFFLTSGRCERDSLLSAAKTDWAVPKWASLRPRPRGSAQDQALSSNRAMVKSANAEGQRYDFVMYGDSITAAIRVNYQKLWKSFFGHWRSASLGVGASTVEDLAARLMRGSERFAADPRVVVVHIGINNMVDSHPAEKLDYLLGWMRAAMPRSRLVVLALLPTRIPRYAEYNAEFEPIAAKHGAIFSRCGGLLDPNSRAHFLDGVHPEAEGYRRIFVCLRPVIEQELRLSQ